MTETEAYLKLVARNDELLQSRANLALAVGLLLGSFQRIIVRLDPEEVASISEPLELARKIIFEEYYGWKEDSKPPRSDPQSRPSAASPE